MLVKKKPNLASTMPVRQTRQTGTVVAIGDGEVFENKNNRITVGAKIYFLEEGYIPIGEFIC